MHIFPNWFLAATLVYTMLSSALKDKTAVIGQFIYCWGATAALVVYTWQLQRGRAEIDAEIAPDDPYTASIIAGHHQELWILLIEIAVIFFMPFVTCWFYRRSQRRAALPAKTV